MSRPNFIDTAIKNALAEEYPSDGVNTYLKTLLCEGYRDDLTDSLLDVLEISTNEDERFNVVETLYYLHGVGPAIFFDPNIRDPRPEHANGKEHIQIEQLERLCRLAVKEDSSDMWDSYSGTLDCILELSKPNKRTLEYVKQFCLRGITSGNTNTKNRCRSIIRKFNGFR